MFATSAFNGFGAGFFWAAQGKFISVCATDENKGFFNGFFWSMFQSAQILGNLMGGFVLKQKRLKSELFSYFLGMALFASVIFINLKTPK